MPVEADYGRLTHHHDSRFVQADQHRRDAMKSDGLPCGVQDVPRHLYVNSDLRTRRTSAV